jgi:hypothetical protein
MKHLAPIILLLLTAPTFAQTCPDISPFSQLPASERARIQKNQCYVSAQRPDLDFVQRNLVFEGCELITPSGYERGLSYADHADWILNINATFSRQQRNEIFDWLPEPELVSDPYRLDEGFVSDCTCSTFWTWCDWGSCSTAIQCIKIINCGPFHSFQCDGTCREGSEW